MSTTISSLPFSLPLHHNSRVSPFYLPSSPIPSQSSITFPTKKWRFLCFKHENTSSEINVSELQDDKLAEDLVKREGDQSDDLKKDWFAAIHATVLEVSGKRRVTCLGCKKTSLRVKREEGEVREVRISVGLRKSLSGCSRFQVGKKKGSKLDQEKLVVEESDNGVDEILVGVDLAISDKVELMRSEKLHC
ncbi:hypothetical protein V8G54_029130 [Vigna mungo]|uniref:Uncharacterized protein n=1 Tax=Vigna mungo TaxID=3915 RepID=A0AAQ3MU96_VIGMU